MAALPDCLYHFPAFRVTTSRGGPQRHQCCGAVAMCLWSCPRYDEVFYGAVRCSMTCHTAMSQVYCRPYWVCTVGLQWVRTTAGHGCSICCDSAVSALSTSALLCGYISGVLGCGGLVLSWAWSHTVIVGQGGIGARSDRRGRWLYFVL